MSLWLIPRFGWRSVFMFGGFVPLVIGLLMAWGLPESLQFLAVQKKRMRSTGATGCSSSIPACVIDARREFVTNEESRSGVPMVHLFHEGAAPTTILLWVVNFTNILIIYSLSNWLPTIVMGMGYTLQTANLVGTLTAGRRTSSARSAWRG